MVTTTAVMNNFTGGLKTEFTGLNFPEDACTDTENCVFSLIGEVLRREGINFEAGNAIIGGDIGQFNQAVSTYRWTNVGGDGQTQMMVIQLGHTLLFYELSLATVNNPLSTLGLASTVNLDNFVAAGSGADPGMLECQFADGNGYLFVFHPNCDPFYCTFDSGNPTVTANVITLEIRDFAGIPDGLPVNFRPAVLSHEHAYNLQNQGWTQGSPWQSTATGPSTVMTTAGTSYTFTVTSGLTGASTGQVVSVNAVTQGTLALVADGGQGTVISYTGSTMVLSVFEIYLGRGTVISPPPFGNLVWLLTPISNGYITTWVGAEASYPSNADIWWTFKDNTGVFNPATTAANISLNTGNAPQGHYILSAFNQQRTFVSGISGITNISTLVRPKTGCWFQGRVWYSGVDDSQQATGDAPYYTWTENIYFSTIVSGTQDFGSCYQTNDPTAEDFNEELATDGGVIVIQGSGSIYNLFPIQNGLLVFAANGIWIIRGNEGLGFTATDYSINKISAVQSISATSIVSINGIPMFWNEEGIYIVAPSKEQAPYGFGGFSVEPVTVGTILSYYNNIPRDSKRYARGSYNPITYIVQWCFRSTQETDITNRYLFDTILNLRTVGPKGPEDAFYPYTISNNNACYIMGVNYVSYPSGALDPTFKYLTIVSDAGITFSEENDDTTWFDWHNYDGIGVDYTSYFVSGYNLHGKALMEWSNTYIYMYLGLNNSTYTIQGIWDYANTGDSGRYTNIQQINTWNLNYNNIYRRHKIRGHGMSLQIKVGSVSGQPFNIFGWAMIDDVDRGI